MKILHLTKKYPPAIGGDAFVVYNLRKQQIKSGHEVYIVTSNIKGIENKDIFKFGLMEYPFNLDRITPRRIVSLLMLALWGFRNLRKLKPDVVHSHSADLGFFISLPARIYGIPVVNTCHGISFNDEQYSFLKRLMEKFFLKYAGLGKIIAIDTTGLQTLKNAKMKNIAYVPNGIDLERFQDRNDKNDPVFKFLFVGRLEKQKGLVYLLEAAGILKDKKDFRIIIIGGGSEAEYLMRYTLNSGLGDIVGFKGKVDEQTLISNYMECDAFVLPSLWEGMPLTLLEAAAAGMPVIASNVGGISAIFDHEQNALIIVPKDAEALSDAMLKLICDCKLRERLGKNARKLAERFSWENTARLLDEIYINASQ